MKLFDKPKITLPDDIDKECVNLCNKLNTIPSVETAESCCGHLKHPFWIWFYCDDISVLSRLGRVVDRNYSDGNWEIVVDSCDTRPYGFFWLRSKTTFDSELDLKESVNLLIENITHWFDDRYDHCFSKEYEG